MKTSFASDAEYKISALRFEYILSASLVFFCGLYIHAYM